LKETFQELVATAQMQCAIRLRNLSFHRLRSFHARDHSTHDNPEVNMRTAHVLESLRKLQNNQPPNQDYSKLTRNNLIAILQSLSRQGDSQTIEQILQTCQKSCQPASWAALYRSYLSRNHPSQAIDLLKNLEKTNAKLDHSSFTCILLSTLSKSHELSLDQVFPYLKTIQPKKYKPAANIITLLLKAALEQSGKKLTDQLLSFFNEQQYPINIRHYSVLINYYQSNPEKANAIFQRMLANQIRPDALAFSTVIHGFCK
jgi:hypothetical protein